MKHALPLLLTTLTLAPAANAAPATGIAGHWTQSSNGSELVIVPRFKLQPNLGYSSPTIVTEPVPLQVARTSTLDIDANGGFTWSTTKRHVETPNGQCTKTTRTSRKGRVTLSGNQMRFQIESGTERWEKSCGGSGQAAVKPAAETYTVTIEGNRMKIAGGPANFIYQRG